jgi:hypothetical protein
MFIAYEDRKMAVLDIVVDSFTEKTIIFDTAVTLQKIVLVETLIKDFIVTAFDNHTLVVHKYDSTSSKLIYVNHSSSHTQQVTAITSPKDLY